MSLRCKLNSRPKLKQRSVVKSSFPRGAWECILASHWNPGRDDTELLSSFPRSAWECILASHWNPSRDDTEYPRSHAPRGNAYDHRKNNGQKSLQIDRCSFPCSEWERAGRHSHAGAWERENALSGNEQVGIPTLERGNEKCSERAGRHSHAGAWEREMLERGNEKKS